MKIAVIGASGFGKYHVREFYNKGVEIVGVLGSSKESSEKASNDIKRDYGIRIKNYWDIESLLCIDNLDAVSICTPPEFHKSQVERALEKGLHVFCEKPFILDNLTDNYSSAERLLRLAKSKDLVLTVNTQWPSVLQYIRGIIDFNRIEEISILMESGVKGLSMLTDFVPHLNSIVVASFHEGVSQNIQFLEKEDERMKILFKYKLRNKICSVNYTLVYKPERPRQIVFSFNGMKFSRRVGEGYKQFLMHNGIETQIEDPLTTSIGKFIGAIEGTSDSLVTEKDILDNVRLQDKILKEYVKISQ